MVLVGEGNVGGRRMMHCCQYIHSLVYGHVRMLRTERDILLAFFFLLAGLPAAFSRWLACLHVLARLLVHKELVGLCLWQQAAEMASGGGGGGVALFKHRTSRSSTGARLGHGHCSSSRSGHG